MSETDPRTEQPDALPPRTIGERLADARRGCALSQAEIGRALRRPQSIVSRWEAGMRAMTPHELVELARVLAVDPD